MSSTKKELPDGCLVCPNLRPDESLQAAGECSLNDEVIGFCECSKTKRYDRCPLEKLKEKL